MLGLLVAMTLSLFMVHFLLLVHSVGKGVGSYGERWLETQLYLLCSRPPFTYQYMWALAAPLLSSTTSVRSVVLYTLINVPCQPHT